MPLISNFAKRDDRIVPTFSSFNISRHWWIINQVCLVIKRGDGGRMSSFINRFIWYINQHYVKTRLIQPIWQLLLELSVSLLLSPEPSLCCRITAGVSLI